MLNPRTLSPEIAVFIAGDTWSNFIDPRSWNLERPGKVAGQ
jgi:hypothetical protein